MLLTSKAQSDVHLLPTSPTPILSTGFQGQHNIRIERTGISASCTRSAGRAKRASSLSSSLKSHQLYTRKCKRITFWISAWASNQPLLPNSYCASSQSPRINNTMNLDRRSLSSDLSLRFINQLQEFFPTRSRDISRNFSQHRPLKILIYDFHFQETKNRQYVSNYIFGSVLIQIGVGLHND